MTDDEEHIDVLQGPPAELATPAELANTAPAAQAQWDPGLWGGSAAPILLGADYQEPAYLGGWTDAVKILWHGGEAAASGAASAGSGIITAVRWWDKHGGQVKIGAALVGGGLLGLLAWKLIR